MRYGSVYLAGDPVPISSLAPLRRAWGFLSALLLQSWRIRHGRRVGDRFHALPGEFPTTKRFGSYRRMFFFLVFCTALYSLVRFSPPDDDSSRLPTSEYDLAKRFKIYVYKLPARFNTDIVLADPRCLEKMFASEIFFHVNLLSSPVRTLNPWEADWFYIPVYATSLLSPIQFPKDVGPLTLKAVEFVRQAFPYWNRTNGTDHFLLAPHDYGLCFEFVEDKAIENGIPRILNKVTVVQTFGLRNHPCMKNQSVVIPPYLSTSVLRSSLLPMPPPRDIFVYFRGRLTWEMNHGTSVYSRGVRSKIYERFHNHSLFNLGEKSASYYTDVQRSVFCLCPLGWAPWSPRIIESIVFGCLPVIISDGIILPFEKIIPWNKFAVFVEEKEVENLDRILMNFSHEEILQRQQVMAKPETSSALLFPNPPEQNDAYHNILQELMQISYHSRTIKAS